MKLLSITFSVGKVNKFLIRKTVRIFDISNNSIPVQLLKFFFTIPFYRAFFIFFNEVITFKFSPLVLT